MAKTMSNGGGGGGPHPGLLAHNLVGVIPTGPPSGLVYALRYLSDYEGSFDLDQPKRETTPADLLIRAYQTAARAEIREAMPGYRNPWVHWPFSSGRQAGKSTAAAAAANSAPSWFVADEDPVVTSWGRFQDELSTWAARQAAAAVVRSLPEYPWEAVARICYTWWRVGDNVMVGHRGNRETTPYGRDYVGTAWSSRESGLQEERGMRWVGAGMPTTREAIVAAGVWVPDVAREADDAESSRLSALRRGRADTSFRRDRCKGR